MTTSSTLRAAVFHILHAPRDEDGALLDPDTTEAEVDAILCAEHEAGGLDLAEVFEEAIFEADGSRKEGEVWQGPSKRWFTLKKGRVVPAKAPQGGAAAGSSSTPDVAPGDTPAQPATYDPKASPRPNKSTRITPESAEQQIAAFQQKASMDAGDLKELANTLSDMLEAGLTKEQLQGIARKFSSKLTGKKQQLATASAQTALAAIKSGEASKPSDAVSTHLQAYQAAKQGGDAKTFLSTVKKLKAADVKALAAKITNQKVATKAMGLKVIAEAVGATEQGTSGKKEPAAPKPKAKPKQEKPADNLPVAALPKGPDGKTRLFHVTRKGIGDAIRKEGFKAGTRAGLEMGPGVYFAVNRETFPSHLKRLSSGETEETESVGAELAPDTKLFPLDSESAPNTYIYRKLFGDNWAKVYDADNSAGKIFDGARINWPHLHAILKDRGYGGILRSPRDGDVGNSDVVVFDPKDIKADAPPATPSSSVPTTVPPADIARVWSQVDKGGHNQVSLADLQDALNVSPEQLHATVQDLRNQGILSAEGFEGRGHSPQERDRILASAIKEDGQALAYVAVRDGEKFKRLASGISESKLPAPDVLTAAFSRHRRLTASQARDAFGSHLTALVESGRLRKEEGWLGGVYYVRTGKS